MTAKFSALEQIHTSMFTCQISYGSVYSVTLTPYGDKKPQFLLFLHFGI